MSLMKRLFWWFGVNLLVIILIECILWAIVHLLGVDLSTYDAQGNIAYQGLAIVSLVWGMAGSIISLFLSKMTVKALYRVQVVTSSGPYRELVQMVERLAQRAGIEKMPEVGVYESDDPNAFATGPSKNSSLVAVSTALLRQMNHDELEAVLAHEISHVVNGDMVTMTLLQGVMNAFVIFFSRIVAQLVARDRNGRTSEGLYILTVIICNIAFSLLANLAVCGFSRRREYYADAGSARLVGADNMIQALQVLNRSAALLPPADARVAALQISSRPHRWIQLYSTHPSIEDRIDALRRHTYSN
ncbi:MAG: protease HtpX [Bacteriovoracaceae bacterium]|nr:protease HtpX [Bacteriovoracaceae bacterium]